MSRSPAQTKSPILAELQSPPIEKFLATVLRKIGRQIWRYWTLKVPFGTFFDPTLQVFATP